MKIPVKKLFFVIDYILLCDFCSFFFPENVAEILGFLSSGRVCLNVCVYGNPGFHVIEGSNAVTLYNILV